MITIIGENDYHIEGCDESSIGRRIAAARKSKGLSQKELGLAAEATPNFISYIERDAKKPSLQLLLRISEITDVPFEYLLGDEALNTTKKPSIDDGFSLGGPIGKILRKECEKICVTSEPSSFATIVKYSTSSDSMIDVVDYCLYVHNSPLTMWIFDLGRKEKSRTTGLDFNYYEQFLSRPLFLTAEQRQHVKLSFVVYSDEDFDRCCLVTDIDLGIFSIIQIDANKRRVVREHYVSRPKNGPVAEALDKMQFKTDKPVECTFQPYLSL